MTVATAGRPAPAVTVAGTTPYPWPWDGDLTASATVLLVVAQDGPDVAPVDPQVVRRLTALAQGLRAAGGRVLAARTRRPARTGPTDRDGAPPWSALLDPQHVDDAVVAQGVDAFYGSDLELLLAAGGTRRLLLAGTPTESCVHSTLRTANDRGLECLLLVDVCLAADPDLARACASTVEMSGGIFGAVGRSDDVLARLVPADPHPTGPHPTGPDPTGPDPTGPDGGRR